MPLPIMLAHKLVKGLSCARRDGVLDYLRPDGKSQVSVEYDNGKPVRVDTVVVSTQHSDARLERNAARRHHREDRQAGDSRRHDGARNTRILINPTGRFVVGGPHGDAGVTGRKIIVDTYGGAAPHGGGAFSGKDPDEGRSFGLLHGAIRRQERRRRLASPTSAWCSSPTRLASPSRCRSTSTPRARARSTTTS